MRWRQQLNENAKVLAHSAAVPEHNHNEIVGWQVASPATRSIAVLVLAGWRGRSRGDTHGWTSRRSSRLARVRPCTRSAPGRRAGSARLASLVQFGDSLSLYLALLGGVDPTDIASIDEFKRRLAERASAKPATPDSEAHRMQPLRTTRPRSKPWLRVTCSRPSPSPKVTPTRSPTRSRTRVLDAILAQDPHEPRRMRDARDDRPRRRRGRDHDQGLRRRPDARARGRSRTSATTTRHVRLRLPRPARS